ncbi:MAG: hypothetical protein P8I03_10385 [Thalassotalea sp.]|nr:hypothetical protein [Thalassotalea sp.]
MRIFKLLLPASLYLCASFSTIAVTNVQYSGVNNVQFFNESYSKPFAGNAFLIQAKNKLYAVTVKHTLFEAKTPEMETITIENYVKEWRIHPNKKPDQYLKLGKLLNENINEAIDNKILQKDWLVFEVLENKSQLKVLKLRKTPVKAGEQLSAFGCTYANQSTCEQDNFQGSFIGYDNNNLRIAMANLDLRKLRGLSGSPVLDANEQVVGIVSNVLPSASGKGFDFAPASLSYLEEVLTELDK